MNQHCLTNQNAPHTHTLLLLRVEALQLLQEDVAVGHYVVSVVDNEKFKDGSTVGAKEDDSAVAVGTGVRVHHHLIKLISVYTHTHTHKGMADD